MDGETEKWRNRRIKIEWGKWIQRKGKGGISGDRRRLIF